MKLSQVIAAVLWAMLPVACQFNLNTAEETEHYVIVGLVAAVRSDAPRTELSVQNAVSSYGTVYDMVIVVVADTTPIYRQEPSGSLVRGGPGDLVVGAQVTVRHTDVIRKSLPPQVDATRVEVKPSA